MTYGKSNEIIAGPVNIWVDSNKGTDGFEDDTDSNLLNFTGEPVSLENQPEMYQLAVDQRSANIRQTLNRSMVVLKTKVEEASLANIVKCFPFAQDNNINATVPADEVWIGISDGSDALKFVSVFLEGAAPDGDQLQVYLPRAVIKGSSTIEYKRDGTQGIPIEICAIQPNCEDEDMLDSEGLFSATGQWTFPQGTGLSISGGVLVASSTATLAQAEQDLAAVNYPRSGGIAGGFLGKVNVKYRITFTVSGYSAGSLSVVWLGQTVAASVTADGDYTVDLIASSQSSDNQKFQLEYSNGSTFNIDNLRVWPLRAVNFLEK